MGRYAINKKREVVMFGKEERHSWYKEISGNILNM